MPLWFAALLPLLWAALRIFIVANIVGFVLRVMVGLGLYFYVFDPLTDQAIALIQGRIGGVPAQFVGWLGFLNIDRYISLILSAGTIAWGSNFALRMRPGA